MPVADRLGAQQTGRRNGSPLVRNQAKQKDRKYFNLPLGFAIKQRVTTGVATINPQETQMTTSTLKTLIKSTMFRFNTLANASSFANRATYPMRIVLGDHDGERGEFWVVTPADASRLERAGYEMA